MRRELISFCIASCMALEGVAAADDMRCGQRLVEPGETMYDVSRKCGPPTSAERHVEYNADGSGVTVDEWIYDRGSQELIRILRFVNGRLRRIEHGGYGY